MGFSAAVCAGGLQKKAGDLQALDAQIDVISRDTRAQLALREDLTDQVESQNDPAWVEMTLMRVLGLVPEGQSKVYFHSDQTTGR